MAPIPTTPVMPTVACNNNNINRNIVIIIAMPTIACQPVGVHASRLLGRAGKGGLHVAAVAQSEVYGLSEHTCSCACACQ